MQLTAPHSIGPYQLTARIGNANMGEVWCASRPSDPHRIVAIKSLSPSLRRSAAMRTRFTEECTLHQSLTHPGIVPVLDCLEQDDERYLVMPYLRGGSLEDLLSRGPLDPSRAIAIAVQILDALNFAHQSGVLHRDVKPSNILLDGDRAFLSDFGVACRLGVPGPLRGESSGTIAYMSPEQIQNPHTADQRSDVYGFGCVLYEMLSGRPPFPLLADQACSDDQLKLMQVWATPIPLRQLNAAIHPRLAELVMAALAKAPASRFAGCGAFALALREARGESR
ncbi:MAG: serine/threonine-protein kinase [Acidobacteria bacterium]|nr:serine/threonine-protein kinase [Acidobacteriota bacterium]